MTADKSLLVIHPGALGDVVLSFSVIERLSSVYSSVHLICQEQIGKVAESLAVTGRSFALESAFFAGLYGPLSERLCSWLAEYETLLLFSISSELERRMKRHFPGGVIRISPRPEPGVRIHVLDHLAEELSRSGLIQAAPGAATGPSGAEFRNRRSKHPVPGRILIHPGAGSRKKRWPVRSFVELAARLEKKGFTPRFLVGPAEMDLTGPIERANKPLWVTEDTGSLLGQLQCAGALVGNDSGVSHLAAFIGLPTVAVFGPSDPVRWAPKGRAAVSVFADGLDCTPCFETASDPCRPRRCFEHIPVQAVVDALHQVMSPAL